MKDEKEKVDIQLETPNKSQPQLLPTDQNLNDQEHPQLVFKFFCSSAQSKFIEKFLPKGYSFQLVNQPKPKLRSKSSKRSTTRQERPHTSQNEADLSQGNQSPGNEINKKNQKNGNGLSDSLPYNYTFQPIKRVEEMDFEGCCTLLQKLKEHPHADYFSQLQHCQKLGSKDGFHLIREPMNLSTIEKKLNEGKYVSTAKFHSDLLKIWHNVFACNQKATQIYRMASEMQKYYEKIKKDKQKKDQFLQSLAKCTEEKKAIQQTPQLKSNFQLDQINEKL